MSIEINCIGKFNSKEPKCRVCKFQSLCKKVIDLKETHLLRKSKISGVIQVDLTSETRIYNT